MQADELLERDRCIFILHLRGRSRQQIAQDIGTSRQTVWRVFKLWGMAQAKPHTVNARVASLLRQGAPADVLALLDRPGAVVGPQTGDEEPQEENELEPPGPQAPPLRVIDGGSPYKAKGSPPGVRIGASRAAEAKAELQAARETWDALALGPLYGADVTASDTRFGLAQRYALLGDQLTQQVIAGKLAAARDALKAYDSLRALLGADRKADDLDDQRELIVSLIDDDGQEVDEDEDEAW